MHLTACTIVSYIWSMQSSIILCSRPSVSSWASFALWVALSSLSPSLQISIFRTLWLFVSSFLKADIVLPQHRKTSRVTPTDSHWHIASQLHTFSGTSIAFHSTGTFFPNSARLWLNRLDVRGCSGLLQGQMILKCSDVLNNLLGSRSIFSMSSDNVLIIILLFGRQALFLRQVRESQTLVNIWRVCSMRSRGLHSWKENSTVQSSRGQCSRVRNWTGFEHHLGSCSIRHAYWIMFTGLLLNSIVGYYDHLIWQLCH